MIDQSSRPMTRTPWLCCAAALALSGCASTPAPRMATSASRQPAAVQAEIRTYLRRIAAVDDKGPKVNAVIALNPDMVGELRRASAIDGPLSGKAMLIKDNIETADAMPTTAGSLALKDNITRRDAPLVAKLRAAGVVILGKTNLSEWANIRGNRSSSGWSGVGGQTRNPHALDRSPCGSSSGSGAAIAAGMAWAAIGTETDGSITCPASVNGIVGLKPTVGLVSRRHIVPISHSQDTPGPMTTSVRDAALLIAAMAGSDPADPQTAEADLHKAGLDAPFDQARLKGMRIGIMRKAVGSHPGVIALFERALDDLRHAGAELVDIDFDPPDTMYRGESLVLRWELRQDLDAYLAGLPGNPPVRSLADVIAWNRDHAASELRWFGQDTFEAANRLTDEEAYRAARAQSLHLAGEEGIDRLLRDKGLTVLIFPTEGPAWPIDPIAGGHGLPDVGMGSLAAIAGYPHLTVPMGTVERLPVGLSFIAGKWQDRIVLEAGAAYEAHRSAEVPAPSLKRWDDQGQ